MAETTHVPVELRDAVMGLVEHKFGGDWQRMFNHYARQGGQECVMDKDDALLLLSDAGIVENVTREQFATGLVSGFQDTSKDTSAQGHTISWLDFTAMMR